MGCVASKKAVLGSPVYEMSSSYNVSGSASAVAASSSSELVLPPVSSSIWSRPVRLEAYEFGGGGGGGGEREVGAAGDGRCESGECSGKASSAARSNSTGSWLGNLHRYIEGEQVAAGWPSWLSAVAAEAVQGWVPLRAESFEKLEKIGQGTYSSVFRARNLETGAIVALKKVRFDSLEPESVRFMSREILILRRLQRHPNVVGLEGLITSRTSCNIYLVFEYMEHDLAGLASAPDISFSEPQALTQLSSLHIGNCNCYVTLIYVFRQTELLLCMCAEQIKCYMKQLLQGLQHCHFRGVMHRDIKCANLLVSNEGALKVADFGLANFFAAPGPGKGQPLTSRVVTLWYRPPELLLGATTYEPSVDLWSAGCVFAEMYTRKPILQGRTEVEQIHKIFKLCGSPPDEYWRRSKMSHAAVFKPQQPYESHLRETFRLLPESAFRLLAALLSVEPSNRGTASTALVSEYFKTKPYACEPSNLPQYAPNKEIDAKCREDSRRGTNGRNHGLEPSTKRLSRAHKSMQEPTGANQRHVHAEESLPQADDRGDGKVKRHARAERDVRLFVDLQPVPVISKRRDTGPCTKQMSHSVQEVSRGDIPSSGPVQLSASTGFAWAKKPRPNPKPCAKRISKGPRTNRDDPTHTTNRYEIEKQGMMKQWVQVADTFSTSDAFKHSEPVDINVLKRDSKKHKDKAERVDLSGPLLSQSRRIDELLQSHERHIRHTVRRSWFQKGSRREQ